MQKYEEKTIFKYELFFLVEYELYDSSGFLKAMQLLKHRDRQHPKNIFL